MTIDERMTDLQHVDRRRRARRLREPRRDDVRVPARTRRSRPKAATRSSTRCAWWRQMASDPDARYDDRVTFDATTIEPTVTWGINPGQSVGCLASRFRRDAERRSAGVHGIHAGLARARHADRRRVHRLLHERPAVGSRRGRAASSSGHHVAPHVKALVVPGSRAVSRAAEARGLHEVFIEAGFEWRGAGCSMCLGDESRQARRPSGVRVVVQPELQGTPGQPDRPHPADESRRWSPPPRLPAKSSTCARCSKECPHEHRSGHVVTGRRRGCRCSGHDIDTDRIMPARFLVAVSFEGLEQHLFEDDREGQSARIRSTTRATTSASILVVNANFGCGSSREHAPQGLVRAGYQRDRRRVVLGDLPRQRRDAGHALLRGRPRRRSSGCRRSSRRRPDVVGRRRRARQATSPPDRAAIRGDAAGRAARRIPVAASGTRPRCCWIEFDAVRAVAARLPYVSGF